MIKQRSRERVVTFLKILAAGCLGILLGLYLTYLAIELGAGLGAVRTGAWTSWPRDGHADIDPYGRARLTQSGEMPLGAAEGLSFFAKTDDEGREFAPSCDYVIGGTVPRARFWTLALLSPDGFPIANMSERYGFTSSEILRGSDGSFSIIIAPQARPGNWLPVGQTQSYVLVLRLYDTELDTGATALAPKDLPSIRKAACR
jgi:hypothetical protein